MKRIVLISLLLVLAGVMRSAAKNDQHLIKANYYYNHGYYFKAIPHLEKAAAASRDPAIHAKLGDCYSITNDLQKATKAYSKAVAMRKCKKDVYLRHAQLLMQLTEYAEAEKWLIEYKKTAKRDSRVDNLIEGCRTAKDISEQMPGGLTTLLPFNTDGSEFAPTRWGNRLVFASDAGSYLEKEKDPSSGRAYYDIYFSNCDDKGNCSESVAPLVKEGKMTIPYHTGPCTFSAEGKTMYYTRSVYNTRGRGGVISSSDSTVVLETMIATYDSVKGKFTKIEAFKYNSRKYAMAHAAASPDGRVLALSSDMPNGKGRSDIYICKNVGQGKWSKPVNAGAVINTEGDELFPYWADDSTLCFSSDGHPGLGGLDIYTSSWDEKTNTFALPVNIGIPINSPYDEMSLALRKGSESTWLSSNRPAKKKGDNIYFYRKMEVYLQLSVIDSVTQNPILGAAIAYDAAHASDKVVIGSRGYFARLYPGDTYAFDVTADGYNSAKAKVLAMTPLTLDTLKVIIAMNKPKPKSIPQKDSIDAQLVEAIAIRNKNVMDSPGVRNFTVDEVYEVGDFQYGYGQYELNGSHQQFLDTMLAQLRRNPTMRIEVQARTDCRGSVASNKALSDKRALSVVNYFIKHGIPKQRLQYAGLGNTRPKVSCPDCSACTEKEHSLNRILEFKVLQL